MDWVNEFCWISGFCIGGGLRCTALISGAFMSRLEKNEPSVLRSAWHVDGLVASAIALRVLAWQDAL